LAIFVDFLDSIDFSGCSADEKSVDQAAMIDRARGTSNGAVYSDSAGNARSCDLRLGTSGRSAF
jgi:hypothetical protein